MYCKKKKDKLRRISLHHRQTRFKRAFNLQVGREKETKFVNPIIWIIYIYKYKQKVQQKDTRLHQQSDITI